MIAVHFSDPPVKNHKWYCVRKVLDTIRILSKSCQNIILILLEKKKIEMIAFEKRNGASYFYVERPRARCVRIMYRVITQSPWPFGESFGESFLGANFGCFRQFLFSDSSSRGGRYYYLHDLRFNIHEGKSTREPEVKQHEIKTGFK